MQYQFRIFIKKGRSVARCPWPRSPRI